jgi:hypothetical protein
LSPCRHKAWLGRHKSTASAGPVALFIRLGQSFSTRMRPRRRIPAGPRRRIPAGPRRRIPAGPRRRIPTGPRRRIPAGPVGLPPPPARPELPLGRQAFAPAGPSIPRPGLLKQSGWAAGRFSGWAGAPPAGPFPPAPQAGCLHRAPAGPDREDPAWPGFPSQAAICLPGWAGLSVFRLGQAGTSLAQAGLLPWEAGFHSSRPD